eukprot:COSAG02_NODE_3621_length_6458_cov_23.823243_3_plen_185_part_00
MCCSFHEEAGGEILNDYYLKHLTSGHPTLPIADLWKRVGTDFSSAEPFGTSISAFRIGHSHEKKRNNLPPWTRAPAAARAGAAAARRRTCVLRVRAASAILYQLITAFVACNRPTMTIEQLPGRAALQAAIATTSTHYSTDSPGRRPTTGSDVHLDAVEDAKRRLACARQVRLFSPFTDLERYE